MNFNRILFNSVEINWVFQSCTSRLYLVWKVFLASYDEYTALVKIGNVASEHVRRAASGMYLWWNLDTLTYGVM